MRWARLIWKRLRWTPTVSNVLRADQTPHLSSTKLYSQAVEPSFKSYRRPRPGVTPSWCRKAFRIERQKPSKDRTDWGFVTPVWILLGLVCVIGQVAALQLAVSVFA